MPDSGFSEASGGDLTRTLESVQARTRDLEAVANGFARAMTGAFSKGVVDGRRFDDVLKSLTLRLSDLALRMAFQPVTRGIATGIESLFQGLFGGLGNKAQPFASGGVIAAPTFFPLGQGGLGVAGEAGAEAILPLSRGPDGRLGVSTQGGSASNVTINIATPDAESFRRSETYLSGLIARAVARGQRGL